MEIENLIRLIEAVSESGLTGVKYEEAGVKIHLTKEKDQIQVTAAAAGSIKDEMAEPVVTSVSTTAPSAVDYRGERAVASAVGSADTSDVRRDEGEESRKPEEKLVESPLVGTFYAAPSEEASPFVAIGDVVKKGQTLAIIEAMKLMNEIESEYDGTVAEILVENGQPVEYGQPLFRIR